MYEFDAYIQLFSITPFSMVLYWLRPVANSGSITMGLAAYYTISLFAIYTKQAFTVSQLKVSVLDNLLGVHDGWFPEWINSG